MPQYVKHSGVWREVKEPYVRHSGSWRSVKEGYVRHAGVWRRFHSSDPTPGDPSSVGQPFSGGYYAGANIIVGGQEYALVVAPKTQGGESASKLKWKNTDSATSGTDSINNGWSNSNAMNNTTHPAARFCRTLNINGHTDWYLPSKDELEICYRYLKPTTAANNTSSGANSNSNPPGSVYTAGNPVQTSISIYQSGGTEAFDTTSYYWTSTQHSTDYASRQFFNTGFQNTGGNKTNSIWVRAVRRVAL